MVEGEWVGEPEEVKLNKRLGYCKIMAFTLDKMGS